MPLADLISEKRRFSPWGAKTRIRCPQCGDLQAEPSLRTPHAGLKPLTSPQTGLGGERDTMIDEHAARLQALNVSVLSSYLQVDSGFGRPIRGFPDPTGIPPRRARPVRAGDGAAC